MITIRKEVTIMGMNMNGPLRALRIPAAWQNGNKPTPKYDGQTLKPEPYNPGTKGGVEAKPEQPHNTGTRGSVETKPEPYNLGNGGGMNVKLRPNTNVSPEDLQNILNNIDNPNIPKFE